MARTRQTVHKTPSPPKIKKEKVKVEKNSDDEGVKIKTEKVEIVKAPGSGARRTARKLSNPKRFDTERRKLIEQTFILPKKPIHELIREIGNEIVQEERLKDVFPEMDEKGLVLI